jgi:mRNA-degrading endonuclease RelE of RelBE toxin-antitoxin system
MFEVRLLPDAEEAFRKLDRHFQSRIGQKIDWLSRNASAMVHHPLTSLPDDLRGLCRIRVGESIGFIRKRKEFRYTLLNIEAKTTNP